jgi:hypothetical protein
LAHLFALTTFIPIIIFRKGKLFATSTGAQTMRVQLLMAGMLACLVAAGCDGRGAGLTEPEGARAANDQLVEPGCEPSLIPESADEGGDVVQGSGCSGEPDPGGGGPGTGPAPTAPQYRIQGQVYPIQSSTNGGASWVKMRGWSRFEKLVNGSWVKVDAGSLSVQCYGGGVSDSDHENGAGFTDVEFWIGPALPGTYFPVQCSHSAVHNGVSYATTSHYDLRMW